jgi:membrane protein YdbS with pleckstrin-like domain
MALINCPECGRQVSTAAASCPACGFPVAEAQAKAETQSKPVDSDELLEEIRPSWWRYFWHLFFFWLLIPPIIAWIQRSSVVLRVYPARVTLKRGLLSRCERELFMKDIRSIDIDQSLLGRMANIGDLTISTAATVDASERILGVPHPHRVRDLIIARRQSGG